MSGIMEMQQVAYCLAGVILLLIVLKLASVPLKMIIRFVINSIVGILILYGLKLFKIKLAIAWWGYAIIGLFGVPGLIFVAILSFII